MKTQIIKLAIIAGLTALAMQTQAAIETSSVGTHGTVAAQYSQPAGVSSFLASQAAYHPVTSNPYLTPGFAPEPEATTKIAGLAALGMIIVMLRRKFTMVRHS